MNSEEVKVDPEQKKESGKITSIICVIIGIVCIGVAAYGLFDIYKDYKVGDDVYQEAESEFVQIHPPVIDTTTDSTEGTGAVEEEGPKIPWYEMASVDIAGLKAKYADVVGWIFFEDGLISYPVMHSHSNDTYLYTTYNGTESIGGSIFVEATHSGDFTDTHTLVYGHNMKNLSMFGRLKHYRRNNDYYENHQYFQIFLEDEILRYRIFAYQEVSVDSFVYKEYFNNAKELGDRLLQISMRKTDIEIPEDGRIITLSTCTADDAHRFVVSAVLVERYSLEEHKLVEE